MDGKAMINLSKADAMNTGQVCACFNLRKTARAVTAMYEKTMKPSGLKATQFTVLMAATAIEPATISELSALLVMDRTTLTRNLKPLEKKGLVKIEQGKDRRERYLFITPDGQAALNRAYPLWETAQEKMKSILGAERLHGLLAMLELTAGVPGR